MTLPTFIGLLGTASYLLSYFLLQVGVLSADRPGYTVMNLAGACCVAYSLLFDWNLPSMVIQLSWIAISLFGLVRLSRTPPPTP